ncbi:hypothetical protein VPHK404_0074 [Vibrio phage K404]
MLSNITISGLHSEPKTFRYGTIIRILRKRGAKRDDLTHIERQLYEGEPAKFKEYELTVPNDKVGLRPRRLLGEHHG